MLNFYGRESKNETKAPMIGSSPFMTNRQTNQPTELGLTQKQQQPIDRPVNQQTDISVLRIVKLPI